jgi:hypothetical protein
VTLNGLEAYPSPRRLDYYSVIAVAPSWGPAAGGTLVRVSGSGFIAGQPFQCRIGGAPATPAVALSDALLECRAPTGAAAAAAVVVASRVTGGAQHHQHRQLAAATATVEPGSGLFPLYDVAVAAVGVGDFTVGGAISRFEFYPTPVVSAVSPREGQTSGGDTVTVFGSGFLNTAGLSCGFGPGAASTAPARHVSATQLLCNTTAHVVGNVSVTVSVNQADFPPQPEAASRFAYTQCAPGFFAKIHTDPCTACPPGFAAPLAGSQKCTQCGRERYTARAGEPECLACPENTFVDAALSDALAKCVCVPGFYEPSGNPGQPCIACPVGGRCDGGLRRPVAVPGFWSNVDSGTGPVVFLQCDGEAQCPGGGDATCSEGHTGRLCSDCEPGFYKNQKVCRTCPSGAIYFMIGFAVFCVLICALIFRVVGAKGAHRYGGTIAVAVDFFQVLAIVGNLPLDWPPEIARAISIVSAPFFLSLELLASECSVPDVSYPAVWVSTMMIPLFFCFIFGMFFLGAIVQNVLVGRVLGRKRHDEVAEALGNGAEDAANGGGGGGGGKRAGAANPRPIANSTSNSNINGNSGNGRDVDACSALGGDANDKLYLAEPGDHDADDEAGEGGTGLRASLHKLATEPIDLTSFADKIINCLLLFSVLSYLLVISAAFEFFDCTLRPDGTWTLDASPSLLCFDPWWMDLLPIGIFGVAVYGIGIPIAFAAIVYRNRRQLRIPRVFRRFSALYFEYRDEYAFWGSTAMLEKFTIGVASTYLSGYLSLQIVVLLVILLTILLLGSAYQPMVEHRNNTLENVLRFCMCCVLLCGLLFQSGKFPSRFANLALTWACLAVIAGAVLFVIWIVVADLIHTFREEKVSVPKRLDALSEVLMCPNGYGLVIEYARNRKTTKAELVVFERVLARIERYTRRSAARDFRNTAAAGDAEDYNTAPDLVVDRYTSACFTPLLLPAIGTWLRVCTARARGTIGGAGGGADSAAMADKIGDEGDRTAAWVSASSLGQDAGEQQHQQHQQHQQTTPSRLVADPAALEALIEFQQAFSALAAFDHVRSLTNTALPFQRIPAEFVSSVPTMRGVGREGQINVIREEVDNDAHQVDVEDIVPMPAAGAATAANGDHDHDHDHDKDGGGAGARGKKISADSGLPIASPRFTNMRALGAEVIGGGFKREPGPDGGQTHGAGGADGGNAEPHPDEIGSPRRPQRPVWVPKATASTIRELSLNTSNENSNGKPAAPGARDRRGRREAPDDARRAGGKRDGAGNKDSRKKDSNGNTGSMRVSSSQHRLIADGGGAGSASAYADDGGGSAMSMSMSRSMSAAAPVPPGRSGARGGSNAAAARQQQRPSSPEISEPPMTPRTAARMREAHEAVDAHPLVMLSPRKTMKLFDRTASRPGSEDEAHGHGRSDAEGSGDGDWDGVSNDPSGGGGARRKAGRVSGGKKDDPRETRIDMAGHPASEPALPETALALGTLLGFMTGLDGEVLEDTTAGVGASEATAQRWRTANASSDAVIALAMRTHSLGYPSDEALWASLAALYGFSNLLSTEDALKDGFPRGVRDRPHVPLRDDDLDSLSSIEEDDLEEEVVPIDEESGDSFTSDNSACVVM